MIIKDPVLSSLRRAERRQNREKFWHKNNLHKLVFSIFWLKMCRVILECCPHSFWRGLHQIVASNSGMALPCSASLGDRACTQACSSGGVMLSTDLPSVLAESVQCVSLAACVQIKCILAAVYQWPLSWGSSLRWYQGHAVLVDLMI